MFSLFVKKSVIKKEVFDQFHEFFDDIYKTLKRQQEAEKESKEYLELIIDLQKKKIEKLEIKTDSILDSMSDNLRDITNIDKALMSLQQEVEYHRNIQ